MTTTASAPSPRIREALSPEHEEIIRQTLPLVGSRIDEIAPTFYRRMFTAHPELLRDTFNRGNQAQGAQQKALAASVATYATLLVTPEAPSPRDLLGRIGHKHASLGITEDQYAIVHENLMAAIVDVLGADVVTGDVAAAWDAVYWSMARTLIAFEQELYRAAGVEPGDVFRTARVVSRVDESSTVTSLVLEAPEGADPLPGFVPGQYISVGAHMPDGARQLRQYSLSGAPSAGSWRISVKRVDAADGDPAGEVSTHLHENAHAGDEIEVTIPYGDLTLDVDAETPVVLVSAGIGATPMLGILHHIATRQPRRRAVVLHVDGDAGDAALAAELMETVEALPEESGSTLRLWFERGLEGAPDAQHPDGRVALAEGRMVIDGADLPAGATYYLCGGAGFLQGARDRLAELGVDLGAVRYELFTPNDWLLPTA